MEDQLREECGVFGICAAHSLPCANLVYYGLYALQHRGQESCGIVVNSEGHFYSHKDLGLLSEVFSHKALENFPSGTMAVGHVRYGTTGGTNRANCQPIEVDHRHEKIALAHNGNLTNAFALRDTLECGGAIFHTTSDTEIIAYLIMQERLKTASLEQSLCRVMNVLEGAYSLVVLSGEKLIAARDPHGLRPLCYGQRDDGTWVVASESCALNAVGAHFERDILPGEIVIFEGGSVRTDRTHCNEKKKRTCIFEYIYFARPDSVIDGISVHMARRRAGRILARHCGVEADIVIGVPDSGIDAALGYAEESGIAYGLGFIKNKYIGRTFISPGQNERLDQVKIKLNPIREAVEDKRVVLIDDSIVRGTTSGQIVNLLREAGAREVHMRISSPPFLNPCYYGTDIDSRDHLIAVRHSVEEIAAIIGADSLSFFPNEELKELIGSDQFCDACFSGNYPTELSNNMGKDQFE